MLKNFTVHPSSTWSSTCPFGGGWTPGQDPTSRGWRVRAIDHRTAVLAQKGGKAAWLVQAFWGTLHLTLYEIPPGELEKKARSTLPEMHLRQGTTEPTSGWALKFIGE